MQSNGLRAPLSDRIRAIRQPLPEPPDSNAGEPWRIIGLQPIADAKGNLFIAFQLQVPADAHREYRQQIELAGSRLASERAEAYAEFLTETKEGRRLLNIRRVHAEARALLEKATAEASQADRNIRQDIGAGRSPEANEAALRAAKADIEIFAVRASAAADALQQAESEAMAALVHRMDSVRQAGIDAAAAAFEHAIKQCTAAVSEAALAAAAAVAKLHSAKQPTEGKHQQLPGS